MPDSNKISNNLINEKSPYLLQHAYNPVSWYPWGGEAFEKAKAEDKPVFLSIGYSTCHWCHVMAHESFEDEEVAEVLNRDYVAVKVDREERPDIDSVYMFVCQALTGSGGWPLTIIMTPEQKPFYAATYLPKLSRWGSAGLLDILSSIQRLWKNERDRVLSVGEELTSLLNKETRSQSETEEEPSRELLKAASNTLSRAFDKQWGGFHRAPKFPMAHNLIFLFRHYLLEGGENVLSMTEKTLKQMYRGGMYDHIGGGFSRYSTDEKWLVPHFEKMLYDNALLLYAYTEGFQITGNPFYAMVSRGILDYVLSVLTDEEGGFYCGQDADSEGVEGKFYTFEKKEITDILGKEQGEVFCKWFGITEAGNFEGKNIPNLIENEDFETENQEIKALCQKLYQYRLKRTTLHTDDKILTSWNGLMIAGVAKAYKVLGDSRYLEAAQKAHAFIEKNLKTPDNRLFIRYRDREAVHDGQLDDYAFYAFGLLELYEASLSVTYLKEAEKVSEKMVDLFFDETQGGFYMYAHDRDRLISRPMEFYDGALPSGNSAAAYVLSRLYHLTGEVKWQEVLEKQISCMAGAAAQSPANHCFALMAFQTLLYPSAEIVAVSAGEPEREEVTALQRETTGNISLLWKTAGNQKELSESAPFTADYPIPESETRYYVCSGGTCLQPVDTLEEVRSLMKTMSDRLS